jgi:hypothetical protein
MARRQVQKSSGIKWNEVTWYSRLGAIILFLGVVPVLCFYIGMQYGLIQNLPLALSPVQTTQTTAGVPSVGGYYPLYPKDSDGSYIKVTQSGSQIAVTGYTTYPTPYAKNLGQLAATTTLDKNGMARLNLTQDATQPCYAYLIFEHRDLYNAQTHSFATSSEINHITVYQSTGGLACGFGNNVSFGGEYTKSSIEPVPLPKVEI